MSTPNTNKKNLSGRLTLLIPLCILAVCTSAPAHAYDLWEIVLATSAEPPPPVLVWEGQDVTPHADACGLRLTNIVAYDWSTNLIGTGCPCDSPAEAGTPQNPTTIEILDHPGFGSGCGPAGSAPDVFVDGIQVDFASLGLTGIHVQSYDWDWLDDDGDVIVPPPCKDCQASGDFTVETPDWWVVVHNLTLAQQLDAGVQNQDFLAFDRSYPDVTGLQSRADDLVTNLRRLVAEGTTKTSSKLQDALETAFQDATACSDRLETALAGEDSGAALKAQDACLQASRSVRSAASLVELPLGLGGR